MQHAAGRQGELCHCSSSTGAWLPSLSPAFAFSSLQVQSSVTFRTVTNYLQVQPGPMTIGIRPAGAAASTPYSAQANFTAAAGKVRKGGKGTARASAELQSHVGYGLNHVFCVCLCLSPWVQFYTTGFLGNGFGGPQGQLVYSKIPIVVNEDVRNVPNPGRFYGLWYRWR